MTNERFFVLLNRTRQREIYAIIKKYEFMPNMLDHGYANGYVAIPPSHPFYKMDYDEANKAIDIHGGLTFASPVDEIGKYWPREDTECIGFDSVDEIPKDYWMFGFDTMHAYDGPHLDRDWCIKEANDLKKQLEEVATLKKRSRK